MPFYVKKKKGANSILENKSGQKWVWVDLTSSTSQVQKSVNELFGGWWLFQRICVASPERRKDIQYSKVKRKRSARSTSQSPSAASPSLTAGGPDCQAAYKEGKSD